MSEVKADSGEPTPAAKPSNRHLLFDPETGRPTKLLWWNVGGAILAVFAFQALSGLQIHFSFEFLLCFAISDLVAIAIHELGHVAAGTYAGFKIVTFAITPLQLHKHRGKWRIGLSSILKHAGFVQVTTTDARRIRQRTILMVAGGPVASLLAAIVGVWLAASNVFSGWINSCVECTAFWSFFYLAISAVMRSRGDRLDDKQQLRILVKGGEEAKRYCSVLLLSGLSLSGVRPRELDPALLADLPGPPDHSAPYRAALIFRYNWLVDSRRLDEAEAALKSAIAEFSDPTARVSLQLQLAWFTARFRSNISEARRLFDSCEMPRRTTPALTCARAKAEAAILAGERKWEEARVEANRALQACSKFDDVGTATAIRDALEELLERITNERASAAASQQ